MENVCRICLDSEGVLITPCKCSGSVAFVHKECLKKWRTTCINPKNVTNCDICHGEYKTFSDIQEYYVLNYNFKIRTVVLIKFLAFIRTFKESLVPITGVGAFGYIYGVLSTGSLYVNKLLLAEAVYGVGISYLFVCLFAGYYYLILNNEIQIRQRRQSITEIFTESLIKGTIKNAINGKSNTATTTTTTNVKKEKTKEKKHTDLYVYCSVAGIVMLFGSTIYLFVQRYRLNSRRIKLEYSE